MEFKKKITPDPDPDAITVASTTPSNNATEVASINTIVVQFSDDVVLDDQEDITISGLTGDNSGIEISNVSVDDNEVTITLDDNISENGDEITVTIGTDFVTGQTDGGKLDEDYSFQFEMNEE